MTMKVVVFSLRNDSGPLGFEPRIFFAERSFTKKAFFAHFVFLPFLRNGGVKSSFFKVLVPLCEEGNNSLNNRGLTRMMSSMCFLICSAKSAG